MRLLLTVLAFLLGAVVGLTYAQYKHDEPVKPAPTFEQGNALIVRQGGTELVTVHPDGSVTFRNTPDAASRIFWEAVGRTMPRCPPRAP